MAGDRLRVDAEANGGGALNALVCRGAAALDVCGVAGVADAAVVDAAFARRDARHDVWDHHAAALKDLHPPHIYEHTQVG